MVAFSPGFTTALAYTSASARAALPAGLAGGQLELQNDGTGTVWVALGGSTVTAVIPASPNNGAAYPILAGRSKLLSIGDATWLAAIAPASGTGTLYATLGFGSSVT
jgi:hypothetical protein